MRGLYRIQYILTAALFFLIILGAGVRIANAGLACPDWPFCFGQMVPHFNFRIFMEWIHRVIAGSIGALALIVAVMIFLDKETRSKFWIFPVLIILLFCVQAVLGRETVTQLLKSEIVSAHLTGGYLLFTLNLLLCLRLQRSIGGEIPIHHQHSHRWSYVLLAVLVFIQAILGARVSSHYAGLACLDFPTCNSQWWPGFSGPVGIQFIHRLGALVVFVSVMGFGMWNLMAHPNGRVRSLIFISMVLVVLQLCLGISMIFTQLHPLLSLAHSATAVGLYTTFVVASTKAT